ncbi:hypothetical protein CWI38_1191p0020 [Hamiltosporidium tvaerminnensis]|uniref:Uncharacterized protein n=1 Tax=Hamiltosporidium tvaerminnensis TaxID=1176355 RepID=A0A4Q9LT61_9MICR|nr:hypothetical protein CWI38_1191p0020 [Hamiltosporidium tvaerminnensis]
MHFKLFNYTYILMVIINNIYSSPYQALVRFGDYNQVANDEIQNHMKHEQLPTSNEEAIPFEIFSRFAEPVNTYNDEYNNENTRKSIRKRIIIDGSPYVIEY